MGGGKKCHGRPKKCIKKFLDYTPFDQGGGGGYLNATSIGDTGLF